MLPRTLLVAAVALATLAGCEQSTPETTGATTGTTTRATTGGAAGGAEAPAWLLTSAPADPVDVAAAKTTASEGDQIAIRGKIGGRSDPMSVDSAVFVVMDPAIPSCADNPGDTCAKPWDYCCEPKEVITANNATIQLVGEDGAPLAIDLSKHGIKPLDEVIAVGTVAARPNEQTLIVKATRLYRAGS